MNHYSKWINDLRYYSLAATSFTNKCNFLHRIAGSQHDYDLIFFLHISTLSEHGSNTGISLPLYCLKYNTINV